MEVGDRVTGFVFWRNVIMEELLLLLGYEGNQGDCVTGKNRTHEVSAFCACFASVGTRIVIVYCCLEWIDHLDISRILYVQHLIRSTWRPCHECKFDMNMATV